MADSDMLKAARAEVQKLEAELAATAAYQKLQLAKQVVEMYERLEAGPAQLSPASGVRRLLIKQSGTPVHPTASKSSMIESVAIKYLREKKARATSGELLKAMEAAGVTVGGQEPNKALSAYLSGSKALNNVREAGGYGLVEWGGAPGPSSN